MKKLVTFVCKMAQKSIIQSIKFLLTFVQMVTSDECKHHEDFLKTCFDLTYEYMCYMRVSFNVYLLEVRVFNMKY
jgi:hypothetical protein